MAEAVALHLVVAHLDHELGPHARLLELTRSPSGSAPRSAAPAPSSRSGSTRAATSAREPRGDRAGADVVEAAVVAVEAEQQRRDRLGRSLPAHADHDAVGRSVLLHLDHRLARAGQVGEVEALRDDAVEPERLEAVEPAARLARVACSYGESRNAAARALELGPPLG